MTLTDDTATAQNNRNGDPIEVARELTRKWQATVVERDKAGGSATEEREDLRASGLLSVTVFPGFLDVASSNQWITVTTKPVLLDQLLTGGSSASLQPTYTVTDAAKTAIMAQVKTITDACTNSHAAAPPKPCDTVAFGVVDGTVNWGPADLSRIKIDNIDNYSSAGLAVRVSGQAFFNNVSGVDQWHAGAIKTLDQQSMYINGSVDLTRSPLTLSQK